MATKSSYNLDKLKKLVSNDVDAQRSFIELFIKEMETKEIPELRSAIENGLVALVKNKVHSIKSNVKFFGFESLSNDLQVLEDDLGRTSKLGSRLIKRLEKTTSELESASGSLKEWLSDR